MSKGTQPRSNNKPPVMRTRKRPQPQTSRAESGRGGSGAGVSGGPQARQDNCWSFVLSNPTDAASRVREGMSVRGDVRGGNVIVISSAGELLGEAPAGKARSIIRLKEGQGGSLSGQVAGRNGTKSVEVNLCLT